MHGGQGQLARVNQFCRVDPGNPNQVTRLGGKRISPTGLSHWAPAKEDVGVFGGASTLLVSG